jgi:hypothetical protein
MTAHQIYQADFERIVGCPDVDIDHIPQIVLLHLRPAPVASVDHHFNSLPVLPSAQV